MESESVINEENINTENKTSDNELQAETVEKTEETSPLSKRQKKKLVKLAEWEIKKKIKRLKEREKYRQKRIIAIEKGEPTRIGPSRKELKRNKVATSSNNLKIAIDLDFDDLMIDKDIGKCVKQLLRIYTINRRSNAPGKLYFTGIKQNGKIHRCLEKNDGYENWDVQLEFNRSYSEIFDKDKIIYLSSDSDNLLDKLDEHSLYVIGGIVDHNHHKGLCNSRAQQMNVRTARLPLNEHVDIKTRQVLSTVHVFEMLLRVSQGQSWSDTILQILPMRKGAKLKNPDDNESNSIDLQENSNSNSNELNESTIEEDTTIINSELPTENVIS